MLNAYEILGLKPTLVLDRETLNAAMREAGKLTHPDAGGDPQQFAAVQLAYETLLSPAKRLKQWLELRQIDVESRGVIGAGMMEWFSLVGEVSQRAEALIRKRESTKSALGLALLENETQLCREAVGKVIATIEAAIDQSCAGFSELDGQSAIDPLAASECYRDLSFLEKWRAMLRGLFARLV